MTARRSGVTNAISPETSFTLGSIANGDVVLIYSRPRSLWGRVSRSINVLGQRLLAAIRRVERVSLLTPLPSHSHAMIGVGGGLVIHADGKQVSVDVISDVILPEMNDAARFVVYRHRQLSSQSATEIVKLAYRYFSQSYGFMPYFGSALVRLRRKEDTTQFCSRLIAHAYRSAGHQLTTLTDNRVLPLDLYRICQGAEWQDVTAEFVEKGFSEEALASLDKATAGDLGGVSFQDFMAGSEQTLRKSASLHRDLLRIQYKSLRDQLHAEATIAKYVSLQLDIAKASLIAPDPMEERVVGWVKGILAQLPQLLDVALLPNVEMLVTRAPSVMMIAGEASADVGAFVGMPTPAVVHEMRVNSEVIRIYAYLLLAELGMLSIASRLTQDAKFQRFAAYGVKWGDEFLAAAPMVDQLAKRLTETREGFLWVDSESDRKICRGRCDSVIRVLQLIDAARGRPSM